MLSILLSFANLFFMATDPEATAAIDSIPWPVQLGLNGVTLGALISFFIWQNRQITLGKWYPSPIVEKMLAEKDATIADKDKQLANMAILVEEQRKTIRAAESTADTNAKALVQATSNQGWIDVLVQRALGGSSLTPKEGDKTPKEAAS